MGMPGGNSFPTGHPRDRGPAAPCQLPPPHPPPPPHDEPPPLDELPPPQDELPPLHDAPAAPLDELPPPHDAPPPPAHQLPSERRLAPFFFSEGLAVRFLAALRGFLRLSLLPTLATSPMNATATSTITNATPTTVLTVLPFPRDEAPAPLRDRLRTDRLTA